MQRKTLLALLGFLGLLVIVVVLEYTPEAPPVVRVTLQGFVPEGQIVAKTSSDLVDPGFTRILLERPDETVELQKTGDIWMLIQPRSSNVEQFKVKHMLLPLQTPTESLITQNVTEDDLRIYGLDPTAAIRVSLFQGDVLHTAFVAGGRQKSDAPDAPSDLVDTWVGTDTTSAGMSVSRMGDKDLHTPYAIALKDLRSKKLFTFSRDDVTGITILNPHNPHPRIVLSRQGEGANAAWSIDEPVGFQAGETAGLVGALANLRASDFVPLGDSAEKGLSEADEPAQVIIQLAEGDPITLRIGAERDTQRFAAVEGSDEIVELAGYNANNLLKNIGDLRNKKVLGIPSEAIVRVNFETDGLVLAKTKSGQWRIAKPMGIPAGEQEMSAFLKDIDNWSVTEFSRVEEREERGLDPASKPSAITFTEVSGKTTRILVGEARNQVHWAMPAGSDSPEMWKLTAFMARKLRERTADDFRNKTVFGLKRDDIRAVTLKHANETVSITPGPEGGESKWIVHRGDELLTSPKSTEISKAMTSLASLVAKSFIARDPGAKETGLDANAFTAKFSLADGTKHTVQLSARTFSENEVYARTSSAKGWSQQLFTVNRFQAENIQRKFKHFK